MRVLQLGPYPPPEGGISRNMLAIRDELHDRGDHCTIIATSKSSREVTEADVHFPRSGMALVKQLKSTPFDIIHCHVGGYLTPKVFGILATAGIVGSRKKRPYFSFRWLRTRARGDCDEAQP